MYIEILSEHLKKTLFQFRIGTYITCRICDEGVLGDEIHFLFECQKL